MIAKPSSRSVQVICPQARLHTFASPVPRLYVKPMSGLMSTFMSIFMSSLMSPVVSPARQEFGVAAEEVDVGAWRAACPRVGAESSSA